MIMMAIGIIGLAVVIVIFHMMAIVGTSYA